MAKESCEESKKRLGLYIHIPFCLRKCVYCDFLSFPCGNGKDLQPDTAESYLAALFSELKRAGVQCRDRIVDTVFIGGGTPSVLPVGAVLRLLSCVRESFRLSDRAEITIEANPGTVTAEKFAEYRTAGINRLSLGFQSLDDRILSFLGRVHTEEQAVLAFREARRAGFDNINVDLIFGLPLPDQEAFRATVEKVIALSPEHISAYSLIVEEGTPLCEKIDSGELPEPDDRDDREDYAYCRRRLAETGFIHYEISNFAKPGRECAHNLKYWRQEEYLGVGLGAASFLDGMRFANGDDLGKYIAYDGNCGTREKNELSEDELRKEFMMLGFRMLQGPDFSLFEEKFRLRPEKCFGEALVRLTGDGFITPLEEKRGFALTEKGLHFANSVFREFL